MKFAAYRSQDDGFSFEGHDPAAGIIGKFTLGEAAPVLTADTLSELEQAARTYLEVEANMVLYLTDREGRVHQILKHNNKKHLEAIGKAEYRYSVAVALLVFCVTCLFAASFGLEGLWALLSFVGASMLYVMVVRLGIQNAIEGAVVCEMILILSLLLILAYYAR